MKLIILVTAVTVVVGDKLQNNYLPPIHAAGSGGSSSFLAPPVISNGFGASSRFSGATSYIPPAAGPIPTARHYSNPNANVGILRYTNDNDGFGHYAFEYETENHINHHESGQLKNAGTDHESNVVEGSYSFTAPDGITYTVNYIADENGFRASGDHIPTPPPIPAAILRSLEINAAASRSGYSHDGGENGQYQPQALNRQYLSPEARSYNPNSGYRY